LQTPEQQSVFVLHMPNWSMQLLCVHLPLVQTTDPAAQQSEVWLQVPPTAVQLAEAQRLLVQVAEQHSVLVVQLIPAPEHAPIGPQMPLVHWVEQQSAGTVQEPPLLVQATPWPQTPLVQLPEQHELSEVHD
jgi:hypothetical protein